MPFIEALAYGHYADCSRFSHNNAQYHVYCFHTCVSIHIYFITLCTVCTKSYAFTLLCLCVYGHLHINFTSQISLQKPILLTYPLYYVARDALLGLLSRTESDIPHVSILKIIPRGSWGFPNITVRKRK